MNEAFLAALGGRIKREDIFTGNTMFINDYMRQPPIDVRATVPSGYGSDFIGIGRDDINKRTPSEILRLFDIRR